MAYPASLLKKYQDHVVYLAKEMGVKIVQKPGMPGMMYVEENPPRIEISTIDEIAYWYTDTFIMYPIEPQTKYLAALHELGHCYHGHTQGRPPNEHKQFYFINGVLKSEAQAWDFALKNCCDEVRRVTIEFALRCFTSYRNHALKMGNRLTTIPNGNRDHVSFVYDDPYGPEVMDILDRLSPGIKQLVNQVA